jgi:hypothetical protein
MKAERSFSPLAWTPRKSQPGSAIFREMCLDYISIEINYLRPSRGHSRLNKLIGVGRAGYDIKFQTQQKKRYKFITGILSSDKV